jgi:methionyl aminopeptidase
VSISIKSAREVELMRTASRIVANALVDLREAVAPGMTTKDLDRLAERSIKAQGGDPAFPYVNHFPGSVCVSVNNEVVHGIPGRRRLQEGDLVKLDVGAIYEGYHGDAAITVPVGTVSSEARRLLDVTEQSLAVGIEAARAGHHLNDIGAAIQDFVEPQGFSMVRQYVGHGIGRELHEEPTVPHYRQPSRGIVLRPGMVLTIEPMVNQGGHETRVLRDGWTVVTADGKLSAQFEHTILIAEGPAQILTLPDNGTAWSIPFQTTNVVH